MISLWFQKGVWRNSVGTFDGCLCLQLIWKPWAVSVRNVPNGPRNLSSHFTTARRKKKVTMNSCIGVNVNPPRREGGRSVCMKLNYLNSLAAEYSSNFLTKYEDLSDMLTCSLLSLLLFFTGWILGTKLVRVSSLCLPRFRHWQRQQHLPAQCPATRGSGRLTELVLFMCFCHQTYVPVRGALKLKDCSLYFAKMTSRKTYSLSLFPFSLM